MPTIHYIITGKVLLEGKLSELTKNTADIGDGMTVNELWDMVIFFPSQRIAASASDEND